MFVFRLCYEACKSHAPCYIIICGLSTSAICFTLFQIRCFFEKIKLRLCFLFFAKFVSNISYFKKNWRYIRINNWITFVKWRTCKISKGLDFIPQFLRNILILIFLTFLWVESELLQTERLTWRGKYFNFVKLRTRLKLWLVFLMSFHRTCM